MSSFRSSTLSSARRQSTTQGSDSTLRKMKELEQGREKRRHTMRQAKIDRHQQSLRNIAEGNPGDTDFIGMVLAWRSQQPPAAALSLADSHSVPQITVCVRKRPMSDKERQKLDHDSVTVLHPRIWIHSAKLKVDGITKYLDHQSFQLDYAFDEQSSTKDVYQHTVLPLLNHVLKLQGGRSTIFAFGQTGSGKTYTTKGVTDLLADDLFQRLPKMDATTHVSVSFVEMYAGNIQDLLYERRKCKVLEDGNGQIVIHGLQEVTVPSLDDFHRVLEEGNLARTTHQTEANDASSRSHAICQVFLRDSKKKLRGKLSLVDLAGSERGSDTKSHNVQRRAESADINTSLLALKECIRALDKNKHVPYRGSMLTKILKDCFTSAAAMTTVIATISPGASAADHSLNTLRYADRIKEQRVNKRSIVKVTQRPSSSLPSSEVPSDETAELDHLLDDCLLDEAVPAKEAPTAPLGELQPTAQAIFEQEEEILSKHMEYISENAELLSEEGLLLKDAQRPDATDEDLDQYVAALESVLDRKQDMIMDLHGRLVRFSELLEREEKLSASSAPLPQY